ncbi:hypothetical protein DIURU_001292 [Diutina rugosa]|uniref:Uncharacterized protein n=1 Tax=Diutina rugosa TaxID=5481 RepID=A0A642UUJ4_DIURU|nr:uncharacterized protein DIURU_001292 [Diutina rugosa]KAA8905915.1 hypothetical protein DIURU_001292 [Diutina rugosa]
MMSIRLGLRVIGSSVGASHAWVPTRGFALTRVLNAKKKKEPSGDLSMVPIGSIGVMADFYVAPKVFKAPISKWGRLLARRVIQFAVNTYSIAKYKRETKLKLEFNQWKETAMEQFVRTNKVFAAACNKRASERKSYIERQLNDCTGTEVINQLAVRAATFPAGTKISWDLVSVDTNPKVISFNALPDQNNLTAFIQFIVQVTTTQKVTITAANADPKETVRQVKDNLVFTLDPFAEEQRLVGSLFESDYDRKVQPDGSLITPKTMLAFTKKCADIYRPNPQEIAASK